jgi:galactose oxidase-like protein
MKLRVAAILTLFYAPLLTAQTVPNWTEQHPQTSPPARLNHAMAYDSVHGQVVLFGGQAYLNGTVLNDTWVWDGSNWTQKTPQNSPPGRYSHAMAYDSSSGQVVLFGGNGGNADVYEGGILNDTWVWDGSNWTQKSPQTSPSIRSGHAMVYDSQHQQVVLFAGYGFVGGALDDTWVWNFP